MVAQIRQRVSLFGAYRRARRMRDDAERAKLRGAIRQRKHALLHRQPEQAAAKREQQARAGAYRDYASWFGMAHSRASCCEGREQYPQAQEKPLDASYCFAGFGLPEFSATDARMSSCKAGSLIVSPARMSIARVALASRPPLNKPCGSSSAAPLKKFSLT